MGEDLLPELMQSTLHASCHGGILVLAAWALTMVLGRRLSAHWRHAMWLTAMVPFALVFQVPIGEDRWPKAIPRAPVVSPLIEPAPGPSPVVQGEDAGVPHPIPRPIAQRHEDGHVPSGQTVPWLTLLAGAWAAGTLIGLGALGVSWRRLRRRIVRAPIPLEPALNELIASASRRAGLARPPAVRFLPDIAGPATFGVFQPVVLLPADTELDDLLGPILLHECLHIRRHDAAVAWTGHVVAWLHWWNPLVWLALRRLRAAQELACDAEVVALIHDRSSYAMTIINIAESAVGLRYPTLATGASSIRAELMERLIMIQHPLTPTRFGRMAGHVLLVSFGLVALAGGVTRTVAAEPHLQTKAIGDVKPVAPATDADRRLAKSLERKISMNVENIGMDELIQIWAKATSTLMTATPGIDKPVTMRVESLESYHVLQLICWQLGCRAEFIGGTIMLQPGLETPPDATALCDLTGVKPDRHRELRDLLRQMLRLPEPSSWWRVEGKHAILKLSQIQLEQAGPLLTSLILEKPWDGRPIYVKRLREKFDHTLITGNWQDHALEDVLAFIAIQFKIDIVCSSRINANEPITIETEQLPLTTFLELLERKARVRFVLQHGVLQVQGLDEPVPHYVQVRQVTWPVGDVQDVRIIAALDAAAPRGQFQVLRRGDFILVEGDEAVHRTLDALLQDATPSR